MRNIAKINMVKQQVTACCFVEESISRQFLAWDRAAFVTKPYRDVAYADVNVPMRHGECMLSPMVQAKMLQLLQLQKHETVLEIGTGNGFFTALLAERSAKVISVEFHKDIAAQAAVNLAEHRVSNVELAVGNAASGWALQEPVDVVVITGGLFFLPKVFYTLIKPSGRILALLGAGAAMQVVLIQQCQGKWQRLPQFETQVPMLLRAPEPSRFVF